MHLIASLIRCVGYEDGSWECLGLDLPLSSSDLPLSSSDLPLSSSGGRPSDEALSRAHTLHVQPAGDAATPTRKITDVRFAPERYLALASADAVVYAYWPRIASDDH